MISTLVLTLVIESLVAFSYSRWQRKPLAGLLLTAGFANLLTQPLLWLVLTTFYRAYLPALFLAEAGIWLMEAAILRLVRANRLAWSEAFALSLGMNLVSFGIGWFLPV